MSSWTAAYIGMRLIRMRANRGVVIVGKIDASPGIDDPRARLLFVNRDPGSDSRLQATFWLLQGPAITYFEEAPLPSLIILHKIAVHDDVGERNNARRRIVLI